jgi:hypothetical protein
MTITNTWNVVQMDAYPNYNGETDVVFTVFWTLIGTDGTYVGGIQGATGLALDETATFTPYADLTQAQVVGWVKAALGAETVASYEGSVAQKIEDQINPPFVSPPLPWAA